MPVPPPDERPASERWWWLALVTAGAWTQLLMALLFGLPEGTWSRVVLVVAAVVMVVAVPWFRWFRRREQQRRDRGEPPKPSRWVTRVNDRLREIEGGDPPANGDEQPQG